MGSDFDHGATPLADDFDFHDFQLHLQGLAGGDRNEATAKAMVADVQRFFEKVSSKSKDSPLTNKLLSIKNIENYYTSLKQADKAATTIAEKLRRIREAVRFVQMGLKDSDSTLYMKAQRVIDFISNSTKKMAKPIKLQRQKHALRMANELATMDDPYDMLRSTALKGKVKESILKLQKEYAKDEAKLLTAYSAAHALYKNSHRSGVIENIKIAEYHQKFTNEDGKFVIQCADHKTGSDGPAQLVLDKNTNHLIDKYYHLVRKKITPNPGCESLLFLTTNGCKYTQVFRKIGAEIRRTGIKGIEIPTPGQYRIMVGTESVTKMDDANYRTIAKHLGHSTATHQRYYELATCDSAVKAHTKLQELAKLRAWGNEDIDILLSTWPLSNKAPPSTKLCISLQQQLSSSKTVKNIIDKWLHLKSKE